MAIALRPLPDLSSIPGDPGIDIPPPPPDPLDTYRRRARLLAVDLYRAGVSSAARTDANDRAVRDLLISIADQAEAIAPAWSKRLRDLAGLIDVLSRRLNWQPIPSGRLIDIARAIAGAANQPWDAGARLSAGDVA